MRQFKEEFGPVAPAKLKEAYGENEYIVRRNLRIETKTRDDGTVENNYVTDSTIYSNQEYVALLESREQENAEAIAELADIVYGGN